MEVETQPGADAPAMPDAASTPAPATEATLDNDLDAIWNAHEKGVTASEQTRDESGRFAKPEGQSEPAEPEPAKAEGEPDSEGQSPDAGKVEPAQQQTAPAIEPPVSWSKEAKEHWAKIPAEAQQVIAQREREAHSYISQLGAQVKTVEPVVNVLKQNADLFEKRGVSFGEGVAALVEAQRKFERDPVGAIQFFAQQAGVDLSMFANGESGSSQSPIVASLQSQLADAQRQISELSTQFRSTREEQEAARIQSAEQEIAAFQAEKQIDDATADAMYDRVAFYTQNHPEMSIRQRLEKAYEEIQWLDPNRRQMMLEKELTAKREAEEKAKREAAEKAQKARAVNVKSSPVASAQKVNLDHELEAIWNRARAS